MDVRCPRCQTVLCLEQAPTGAPVRCGACNALFVVPKNAAPSAGPGGMVIDIEVEPVQQEGEDWGDPGTVEEVNGAWENADRRPPSGTSKAQRYVIVKRKVVLDNKSGTGCCGCGCFLLLLLMLLWIVGCVATVVP